MTEKTNASPIPGAPRWHSVQDEAAFLTSIFEASTEYSIVAMELDGTILAWNEGARLIYGYEPAEVVGRAKASVLYIPKDVDNGLPEQLLADVRRTGKWEGVLRRMRKNGEQFSAHVTMTLRRDPAGTASGFTMISRDLSDSDRISQELQKSEHKFRHLLEAAPDAMIIVDEAGKIVLVNAQTEKVFGYRREELLGQSIEFLIPERFRGSHVGHRTKYSEKPSTRGMGMGLELYGLRKDGTEFPMESSLSPLETESGILISTSIRDISEQKRMAEDLQRNQEYNRGLIESNIDALMTTDPLGIITDVNLQMCKMTDQTREELIGTLFKTYFTDPQRAEDGIRKVLSEERVTNYELTMRSKTGKETEVSYNATTFRGTDRRLRGVFAAARDITDQKRMEEELRQTQNYTRGLIEASVDALMTVDPAMSITDVNEQTVRMTGYSRDELMGSPFPDYFTEPDQATAGVQKTLSDGFVKNYVLVLRSKTGQETPVSFNASVFKDTQGLVRGIFAAARDITEQTRLEEELRQAQNYTRGLIESSVDPMITVNPTLVITDVNEQMVSLTGIKKEKLIGSRFDGYFTEPEQAAAGVRKTLSEGYVTNYELTLKTPTGQSVLVSFNASIFKDTAGQVRGIFAVARDVTEQRHLEEQLREQQNYSRGLIEASVDALMTVDTNGIITDVNEQTIRQSKYTRKKLVGSPFAQYFTDQDRARAGVRKTFDESIVTNYELVLRPKAGPETAVSFNASVFKDTAGNVAGILAGARDITQQRKTEQELREQQAYNRGLIESNIDALMTTDPLGLITDINRQMCEITGRTRAELIGTPFKTYFTDSQRAEDGIRRVLAEGRVTNYELTIQAKGGLKTVVSYNATTLQGEDGRLRGVFAAARDITEQKRLDQELREQQAYNRGLIESSVDAMLTVSPDLIITDVNEQMVRLTGYTREQLIDTVFQEYFTEPDRASAGVKKTLNEGYVTNYELTLRSRHRREILVSFNASIFKDTAGQVRGIFAVARDVTEQRRLEERIRESEHYNRGLIESSVDALVTVDPDLTITDVNEQTIRLTGFTRDELIGSPFKDYFTEPDRASAGVRLTLAEGSVTNYELVLKAKNGKRTTVSFNAGTFRNMTGHICGILAAARDITAQKRLEEQLRDQQNYNRGLIEASVDALMTVDPNGVISDVNEQTIRLTGYNRKHLIGSPFADYFTDPERAMAGVHKTFSENVVNDYELIARSKAGRKISVSFNAAMFRDASGAVQGILAGARDITQQKKIEQELREQQTYTRGLIESNIDALMTTDTLGVITDVNRQMCEITGHIREELIGTPFKTYFTDPPRAEDGIRRVLTEDRVTNYELTIRAKDGRETVVSYNATTFKGEEGRLRGVFAAARDITEQKRLEEQITTQYRELSETSTFLNNILESSTEYSIIAKDLKGIILKWNEGAHRTYGYTADEMVGKQNSSILHTQEDLDTGRVETALRTAFQTGKFEGEFERRRKNGNQFTSQVAITLRRDVSGNPIGYVLISKDITEQKALKEQIRRKNEELEEQYRRVQAANRLKSEFLANMSHELRSPLNSIIGFAQLMHDGKVGSMAEQHKEFLGDILTSSNHLLQLINDVLDLAKVESGKMEFHPEKVELKKLAVEVCVVLRQLAANKRIHIESHVDASLFEVVTDPAKLKQVLYNFLSNAIKFTPDGGHVTLRFLPEDDTHYRLEVEDTGIGIKQEDFPRLFVEFQQLDASTAKKYQGTGLGLALTKRIAESQGGRVGMKSELGKGSVFFAVLPRVLKAGSQANAISVMPSPIQLQPASSEYPRILVVEDRPSDLAWLQTTLSQAGYQVQTAQTGKEAVDLVMRHQFDVITMDLLLPDISGREVLKAIRTEGQNRDTPVVILTVVADRSLVGEYEIYDILGKPVEAKSLLHTLRRARMPSNKERPILIIDDDPAMLKQLMGPFIERGYRAILETDAEQGLRTADKENPAAVILDLRMPGLDGFNFLSRFRRQEQFCDVPVIVWTVLDLTEEQHKKLNAMAQGVAKKESGVEALLAKFDACLKPFAKKKVA